MLKVVDIYIHSIATNKYIKILLKDIKKNIFYIYFLYTKNV